VARKGWYKVHVGGSNITAGLKSCLQEIEITDNEGTQSDTCSITVDDRGAQIALPRTGASVTVSLGWDNEAGSQVFVGTVDDVKSKGSKNGGMTLTIGAKGIDTLGKGKQPQQKHKDNGKASEFLNEMGKDAGISVQVEGSLDKTREWWGANDDSFFHTGERIASELGGIFKVQGNKAIISPKNGGGIGGLTGSFTARRGSNLIDWDLEPDTGRPQFQETEARWFDMAAAEWKSETGSTKKSRSQAKHRTRFSKHNSEKAKDKAGSNAKDSDKEKGGGSVTVDGSASPRPGSICTVSGARPGVDGPYRIKSVRHNVTRDGGWTTALTLTAPDGSAGTDSRGGGGGGGQ